MGPVPPAGDMLRIRHKDSNFCWQPETPIAADNSPVILAAGCDTVDNTKVRFKLLPSGQLLHVDNGKCVRPLGGKAAEGVELVFWESCPWDQSYRLLAGGRLQDAKSGLCVHPNNGGSLASSKSTLVLGSCLANKTSTRFQFEMWNAAASSGEAMSIDQGSCKPKTVQT